VVIELKRGQTSDATVGQVLRYINWVKANLAAEKQDVRGIIVASDVDEALKYAARGLPHVDSEDLQRDVFVGGCEPLKQLEGQNCPPAGVPIRAAAFPAPGYYGGVQRVCSTGALLL
jgi:hypothetical protein